MTGLKIVRTFPWTIYSPPHEAIAIQPGHSLFTFYFRSILPLVRHYYWILEKDSIYVPIEWQDASEWDTDKECYISGPMKEFESLCLDRAEGHIYSAPDLMAKFAVGVKDDWNSIFGFRTPVNDMRSWLKEHYSLNRRNRRSDIENTVDVSFLNVDGAYWGLFSRDASLIEMVRNDLSRIPGFRLSPITLKELPCV